LNARETGMHAGGGPPCGAGVDSSPSAGQGGSVGGRAGLVGPASSSARHSLSREEQSPLQFCSVSEQKIPPPLSMQLRKLSPQPLLHLLKHTSQSSERQKGKASLQRRVRSKTAIFMREAETFMVQRRVGDLDAQA